MTDALILAVETSVDVCSVAVRRGEQFVAEHVFRHGMHLSERLMGHFDAVLRDADAVLDDVTAFAVGIGPGSFTGTRIGVMTAKTLAAVTGKPIIGINSLEAMAAEYAGLAQTVVAPLLPCRTGVVYTAAYRVEATVPAVVLEPAALPVSELAALSPNAPNAILLCGAAVSRYESELRDSFVEAGSHFSIGSVLFPRASVIAHLARIRLASGLPADDPIELTPLYISPPPITLPKQPLPLPPEEAR